MCKDLLEKLPSGQVANYAQFARGKHPGTPYNLVEFPTWLENEAECQLITSQVSITRRMQPNQPFRNKKPANRSTYMVPVAHVCLQAIESQGLQPPSSQPGNNSPSLHIVGLKTITLLCAQSLASLTLKTSGCWRCACHHRVSYCEFKKPCPKCQGKHLGVLHKANRSKNPGGISYQLQQQSPLEGGQVDLKLPRERT